MQCFKIHKLRTKNLPLLGCPDLPSTMDKRSAYNRHQLFGGRESPFFLPNSVGPAQKLPNSMGTIHGEKTKAPNLVVYYPKESTLLVGHKRESKNQEAARAYKICPFESGRP